MTFRRFNVLRQHFLSRVSILHIRLFFPSRGRVQGWFHPSCSFIDGQPRDLWPFLTDNAS